MDSNLGKIKIIKSEDVVLDDIQNGQVHMKHWYGTDVSVAIFKLEQKKDNPLNIPKHSHGQEVVYVLSGATNLNGNRIEKGDIVIIPPGLPHGGDVMMGVEDEEVVLLSIITPPRSYGPEIPAPYVIECDE